jgi:hypothetical protein
MRVINRRCHSRSSEFNLQVAVGYEHKLKLEL